MLDPSTAQKLPRPEPEARSISSRACSVWGFGVEKLTMVFHLHDDFPYFPSCVIDFDRGFPIEKCDFYLQILK